MPTSFGAILCTVNRRRQSEAETTVCVIAAIAAIGMLPQAAGAALRAAPGQGQGGFLTDQEAMIAKFPRLGTGYQTGHDRHCLERFAAGHRCASGNRA